MIKKLQRILLKNKHIDFYLKGRSYLTNLHFLKGIELTTIEKKKNPNRSHVINYILSSYNRDTTYLEIGVRNPANNFNHIKSVHKYSVDPGIEYENNPVDFPLTSDQFFEQLENGEILNKQILFDVIFIDGLHTAEQVNRDIENALKYIKEDGFIVLHDCNPPTEWHARGEYHYTFTPALNYWNGTTWKAFMKYRHNPALYSCCIDTDWGVGIISKKFPIGNSIENKNEFFEYSVLDADREKQLNLISFEEFKKAFNSFSLK